VGGLRKCLVGGERGKISLNFRGRVFKEEVEEEES
jgi:hypothetical protein